MPAKRPRFNRKTAHAGSWWLASSLYCPQCGGSLRGNKVHAWCMSWHCGWWCLWDNIDAEAESFNSSGVKTYLQPNNFCLRHDKSLCRRFEEWQHAAK